MPDGYDSHADYMGWVADDAKAREVVIGAALRDAFAAFIEVREVDVINFSAMTALELAAAIQQHPVILKPIIACCNIAARAIERDLDIRNVNTYEPRLSPQQAAAIAGYVKPFLPQELPIPALAELDRHFFVDKEIRKLKGQWEQQVRAAINRRSSLEFKKRWFEYNDESFEIDAAAPLEGSIEVGIDIKRIEARRDIHKRTDEIVNKAGKFKQVFPQGKFAVVVYYPFSSEHINVQSRLKDPNIDALAFASVHQEQIETAVGLLLAKLKVT